MSGPRSEKSGWGIRTGSIVVAIALVGLYWMWPAYRHFLQDAWRVLTSGDEGRIESWVGEFGLWGPLVIVFLMILQMVLVVAPSWLLMVIAVLAYGAWGGFGVAMVAVVAASSVGYGIGHGLGRGALDRLVGEKGQAAVARETERYGIWAVVIARANPLLSNDAISVAAGMVGMGFWRFLGATVAGIAPLAIAISLMGRDWTRMREGLLWISLVSLAGLGLKVFLDRRKAGC